MSLTIYYNVCTGNGKVDGTPLKCFGKVWYQELIKIVRELLPSSPKSRKGRASKPGHSLDRRNKGKPESKNLPVKYKKEDLVEYKPTNIGLTFDHEYHGWKRVKSYWKYCQDDEENLNLNEVLKDL